MRYTNPRLYFLTVRVSTYSSDMTVTALIELSRLLPCTLPIWTSSTHTQWVEYCCSWVVFYRRVADVRWRECVDGNVGRHSQTVWRRSYVHSLTADICYFNIQCICLKFCHHCQSGASGSADHRPEIRSSDIPAGHVQLNVVSVKTIQILLTNGCRISHLLVTVMPFQCKWQ